MTWTAINGGIPQEVIQKVTEELIETLPKALERSYGSQPLSSGDLVPIVSPGEMGVYDPATRVLQIKKWNPAGVFRIVSRGQTGSNVLSTQLDLMQVILHNAQGEIRINQAAIDRYLADNEVNITNINDATVMAKGWKTYIETYGYTGDLAYGLQGLQSIPYPEYLASGTWASLTGSQLVAEMQSAISAHESGFAESDLKILALPTASFNVIKQKYLDATAVTVMEAFLKQNPQFAIIKVPQLNGINNGADMGFMLPRDPEKLALCVDESVKLKSYPYKTNIMVRGDVSTGLMVAMDPTSGLRLIGI